MKYLVMVGAKHTAKMSYCAISQNHPTEPMSIFTVTSISQGRRTRQREGPVQSTSLGHTASKWLHQDSRPYLLDSRAQYSPTPPHPPLFFFLPVGLIRTFCFLLKVSVRSISISTLHPFRLSFVIFNLTTMFKPVCSNKYSFLSDIDCSFKINKIMISFYILTFSAYTQWKLAKNLKQRCKHISL